MDESRVDEDCGVGVDLGNPKEEEKVRNLSTVTQKSVWMFS